MEIKIVSRKLEGETELGKYDTYVVTRQVGGGIPEEIRVRVNEDGTLNINSNNQLKIMLIASNSVFIDFSI